MSTTIGANIALQGEREFRAALSEINAGLRVNASELALVSARYADNSRSVEALTSRGQALERQQDTQRQKVERLRAALANATEAYGATDRRTLQWQESLNRAEAALIQTDQELSNNSDALQQAQEDLESYNEEAENAGEQSSGLGSKISDMAGEFGVTLPAGADKALKSLDGMKTSTLALVGAAAGLVAGLGKLTIETAEQANEITKLAQMSGMSVEAYQEWDYVLKNTGYSMEQASGDMAALAEKAMEAAEGSGESAEIFSKLGVKVTDAWRQLRSQEDIFADVVTGLQGMRNETERNAIASALLSTTGEELVPVLNMTAKELEAVKQNARDTGLIMDKETVGGFTELSGAMDAFDEKTDVFKQQMALVMLPVLTELFDLLNMVDPKTLAVAASIGAVAITGLAVTKVVIDLVGTFGALNPATLKTTAIVLGVVAALIALAAIIAVIMGKSSDLERSMTSIGQSVGSVKSTVNNAGNNVRIGNNASGTNNWRGGLTWVHEQGGELIDLPSGTRIIPHDVSMEMARSAGASGGSAGGDTIVLNVNMSEVDEVYKLVNVVKQAKQARRAGFVGV